MISNTTTDVEESSLHQVAEEYRREGYTVLIRPGKDERPAFLAGFEPDLIAMREHERVIVEVKSRVNLHGAADLVPLAAVVDAQPGWRLDLVVPDAVDSQARPSSAIPLSPEEIQARIAAVRQIAGIHQDEAALVLAWSAAEAALRLLAARYTIDLENEQPSYMLKKLYAFGALSREDYDFLRDAMRFRSVIVHGYRSPTPSSDLTDQLVGKVERFLNREPVQTTT